MANKNYIKSIDKVQHKTDVILPMVDINMYDAFTDEDGQIIDFFQIISKDIMAAKDHDIIFDMTNWTWLYKSYEQDIKIICMKYPVDSKQQVSYLEKVISRTENPRYLKELEEEKLLLEHTNKTYLAEEFYLMFFSKDEESYKRNKQMIKSKLSRSDQINEMSLGKKIQILNKMQNMNSSLTSIQETKAVPRGLSDGKSYNHHLLASIQPTGGVSFKDEKYVKKGDGYETCIHLFKYASSVRFAWLSYFTSFENTITTIDMGNTNKKKVVANISSSLDEQLSRYTEARFTSEKYEAQRIYRQLETLNNMIQDAGEILKRIHIRIFVFDKTLEGLEKRVEDILVAIEGKNFRASIFLGETDDEWKSKLLSISQQDQLLNSRYGVSVPSESLALGHPFHFSSLADPWGTYWGYTKTGGTVFYNPYQKDKYRLSYSSIVTGRMGSGKTTFMKRSIEKDIIQGNYVRGFAVNNEFDKLIRHYGGSIISLDGSDGKINILHVYKTDDSETSSFMYHMERVSSWYQLLKPDSTPSEVSVLKSLIRELYRQHMGYDFELEQETENPKTITGQEPTNYPILSDLYNYLLTKIYNDVSSKQRKANISETMFKIYESIEIALDDAIRNLGKIFNGHSSIKSFEQEQIVFFNVAGLLKMDSNVFDSQLYSAYYLLWENMMRIGMPQKELFDKNEIALDEVTHFRLYEDEAHHYINARKLYSIRMHDRFAREARKFFAGLMLATQQMTDFFPADSSSEGLEAMNNLFALSQYRVFFQQPVTSAPIIKRCVGDEIPGRDLEALQMFEQGECILNIAGVASIRFQVEIPEDKFPLYAGGA